MMRHRSRQKKHQRKQQRRHSIYHRFKRSLSGFAMLVFITTFAVPVLAAGDAGEKLAEGVEETATGWVEVPKEMAETTEESNVIEGVTVGTVKGAGEAVVKTTEGAVKAATFYIPDEEQESQ